MTQALLKAATALVAAALLADPAAARSAVPRPSFDCRRAGTPTERAICASADLAEADRRIARRYGQLRTLLGPARDALAEDQGTFLAARDQTFEAAERDTAEQLLLGAMLWRADFLERIEATAAGVAPVGRWESFEGAFTLTREGADRIRVTGGATEQVDARWTCAFEGVSTWAGEALRFADPQEPDWRMTIRPLGPALALDETDAEGDSRASPFCGLNGRMRGTYFRVRAEPFDAASSR